MKGINYLQMIEEAKTNDEALDIITKVNDEIIPKVEVHIDNEYSTWTDDELSEYLDMLYKVESYYYVKSILKGFIHQDKNYRNLQELHERRKLNKLIL